MSDDLIELSEEMTEQARHLVFKHIDKLNEDFAKSVAAIEAEADKWNTLQKRGTYFIWVLFWVSGFLARGLFTGPVEWNLASFAVGISTGVCVYWGIYGALHTVMLRMKR